MVSQFLIPARWKPLCVDLIAGGLLLAVLGLLGTLAYWPMRQEALRIEEQAALEKALLNRKGEIEAGHRKLQEQLAEKLRLVAELEQRVPPEPREADFFGQVAKLSKEQGVKIHGFRPLSQSALDEYHVVKVAFDASAEYEPLCHFLDGLGKLARLNHITRMQLTPESPGGKVLSVKIETDIYFTATASKGVRS